MVSLQAVDQIKCFDNFLRRHKALQATTYQSLSLSGPHQDYGYRPLSDYQFDLGFPGQLNGQHFLLEAFRWAMASFHSSCGSGFERRQDDNYIHVDKKSV